MENHFLAADGRALLIDRRLAADLGPAPPRPTRDPISELVLTILSQNTSDTNSLAAERSLRRAFPSWEQVLASPIADVERAVRVGGLPVIKSRRIQQVLEEIRRREGSLSLDSLRSRPTAEVLAYLTSIPGVGPKTAACVALFSLGKAAFPVDTHVLRVCRRLGLLPERASAEQAHELLAESVPPRRRYAFHVHLIAHGRAVCQARLPRCEACPVTDLCDYYLNLRDSPNQRTSARKGPAPAAAPSRR